MLEGAVAPPVNYLVYGSPTISGNTYTPDLNAKGFIYTNQPFNPGESEWIIQTKIKINNGVAWRDIIASVDISGNRQYSIVVQTSNTSGGYGLYMSSNGTSWNIASNNPSGTISLATWRVFQIVCTRSGSNYVYKMGFPELGTWTANRILAAHPIFGKYISFGGGFSSVGLDCDIDLTETKIWVGGNLWWEAIPSI